MFAAGHSDFLLDFVFSRHGARQFAQACHPLERFSRQFALEQLFKRELLQQSLRAGFSRQRFRQRDCDLRGHEGSNGQEVWILKAQLPAYLIRISTISGCFRSRVWMSISNSWPLRPKPLAWLLTNWR